MSRTLIFGILLFIALFILNLKLHTVGNKSMAHKLGVFFGILTLLFLSVGGINNQFDNTAIVTSALTAIFLCFSFTQKVVKFFNGKVDVGLGFCLLIVILCEVYTRLDPYSSFLYLLFKRSIDVNKIEVYAIIGFILFLSYKIFAGIFLKKDLDFLDKKQFQVKDGKGK